MNKFISVIAVVAVAGYVAAPISAHGRITSGGALKVNCNKVVTGSFLTIGAALNTLNVSSPPTTITVTGACHENVVIQSLDRLTLNANPGASITDASGGNADVIAILDSRGVSINNFTINGGGSGINCSDGSLCRLNGNTIQNAVGVGVEVFAISQAVVTGGTIQGNGDSGVDVRFGSSAELLGVTIVDNAGIGIQVLGQAFVRTNSTIANNGGGGIFLRENAYFRCAGCQITGNAEIGVLVRRESSARFLSPYAVTGNLNGGILLTESSSAFLDDGTVTGNPGGMDVFCSSSFTTAKGATTSIGGGTTNCAEPPE